MGCVVERVDWTVLPFVADHMFDRHQVTSQEADEAVNDVEAVWYDPDPKSKSGRSARDRLLAHRRSGADRDPAAHRGRTRFGTG